jgi:hypothetical protein
MYPSVIGMGMVLFFLASLLGGLSPVDAAERCFALNSDAVGTGAYVSGADTDADDEASAASKLS